MKLFDPNPQILHSWGQATFLDIPSLRLNPYRAPTDIENQKVAKCCLTPFDVQQLVDLFREADRISSALMEDIAAALGITSEMIDADIDRLFKTKRVEQGSDAKPDTAAS